MRHGDFNTNALFHCSCAVAVWDESADGKSLLLADVVSISESHLYLLDLSAEKPQLQLLTPFNGKNAKKNVKRPANADSFDAKSAPPAISVFYAAARFAPDK